MKLLTYQCSQLSTPESIIDVFNSAQKLQNSGRSELQIVSLVVLDEVGLAEDSPSFPLKVLHPLLEDGTDGSGMEGKVNCKALSVKLVQKCLKYTYTYNVIHTGDMTTYI